jgi:hypothetical protein
MSTSIADLLQEKQNNEPPEIAAIKSFVLQAFDAPCSVQLQTHLIVIGVSSAALAGSLRARLHELQGQLDTKKRLTIRIN